MKRINLMLRYTNYNFAFKSKSKKRLYKIKMKDFENVKSSMNTNEFCESITLPNETYSNASPLFYGVEKVTYKSSLDISKETNEESKISCVIMKRNNEPIINRSKTKQNSFTSLQLKLLEQISSETICLSHKPNQQFKEDKEFYDLSDVSDFDLDE